MLRKVQRFIMLKRRTFLNYGFLFLGGCTFAKMVAPSSIAKTHRLEKLRSTVTDLSGLDELERDFGAFRQVLEEVLTTPIVFHPVENYSAAAPALLANVLDFALAGSIESTHAR